MKKLYYKATDLVCLDCGNVLTIQRIATKLKKFGHIKDMYCPFCKRTVKFYEIIDANAFKWQCENKIDITEEELFVMNLLKEREIKNDKSEHRIFKKILTRK